MTDALNAINEEIDPAQRQLDSIRTKVRKLTEGDLDPLIGAEEIAKLIGIETSTVLERPVRRSGLHTKPTRSSGSPIVRSGRRSDDVLPRDRRAEDRNGRLGHLPDRLRHMVSRGVPYSRGRHLRHRLHHGTYRVAVIYIGLPGPETPETEVQEGFGRKKEHRTFCEFAGLTRVGLIFMKSFRADRTDLGKAHTSNSRRQIKAPSSWA